MVKTLYMVYAHPSHHRNPYKQVYDINIYEHGLMTILQYGYIIEFLILIVDDIFHYIYIHPIIPMNILCIFE